MLTNSSRPIIKTSFTTMCSFLITIILIPEFISLGSALIVGISGYIWPWSFALMIIYGFWLPVFIASTLVLYLVIFLLGWYYGGISRWYAEQSMKIVLIGIIINSISLVIYYKWQGFGDLVNWLSCINYLFSLHANTLAFRHFAICFTLSNCVWILLCILLLGTKIPSKEAKIWGNAHFSKPPEIQNAGFYKKQGLIVGQYYGGWLSIPGYESIMVIAPTGARKTESIAITNLLTWEGSGVFNDIKGELYQRTAKFRERVFKQRIFCWAPADEAMECDRYNPFFYVSNNPKFRIRDLQLIAITLVPSSNREEFFWTQASREIFLVLSLYLLETQGSATLSEIHDLSKRADFFDWLTLEALEKSDQLSDMLKYNINAVVEADHRTRSNILKDFHARMLLFSDPIVRYATSGNDFDFSQVRRKQTSIYIKIPEAEKERLGRLLTLFWTQFINIMTQTEPNLIDEPYPVLALLDEFGNMAKIAKLKDGLSFMRSYRIRCVIIIQYVAQLRSIYGNDDAQAFLNCKTKIVYALSDLQDAELFSRYLGNKATKINSRSVNSGSWDRTGGVTLNASYHSRPLMLPTEIMQMNKDESLIIVESQPPIKAKKLYLGRTHYFVKLLRGIK